MTSLVIVDLTPLDKVQLAQYSEQAAVIVAEFGGQFIAKGEIEVLHGDATHSKKAVIQFPDKATAKSWYHSAAYQAIIPLREQGMQSQFHLV
ncbi:DUF1330 domain-containing protein [Motilimonas sp. E26]|uniref:DUF1330 domain-containing protein n=1 Tax=Motilimonas sp. E26 TaxID=2865674 RepID=UPI001E59E7D8|nr:DUF1330 domain-containing protein [Motilimonas sp. E26]MCE0559248.1 DUF1330 domain-containing protein [Motilimonas sp. E26]